MTFWKPKTAFDLIVEQPAAGVAPRRLQRFAGFVQSNAPLPPFRILLGGVEQRISRHDDGDPNAPVDRRHTAYFHFHTEVAPSPRRERLDMEAFVGPRRIGRRTLRRGEPCDRTGPLACVLHIPKTAGTSLRVALDDQPALRVLSLYEAPQFISISSCEAVSPTAFDDLDVVIGHFVHGLHRVTRRPCRYVTVLRHPADLLRSTYLFHKHVLRSGDYAACASIFEAQAANFHPLDNIQTRFLAGKTEAGPVTEADLATAIANMERDFAYVGTVEDMAASVRAIGAYLDVSLPCHTVNQTPPSAEAAVGNDEIVARLGPSLAHDTRLYEHARTLFAAGARG